MTYTTSYPQLFWWGEISYKLMGKHLGKNEKMLFIYLFFMKGRQAACGLQSQYNSSSSNCFTNERCHPSDKF